MRLRSSCPRAFSLFLATLAAIPACRVSAGVFNTTIEEDFSSVHAVLDQQVEAWNAGDLATFLSSGYWDSPELTFLSGSSWYRGYSATRQRYMSTYGESPTGLGRLSFTELETRELGPSAILARGRWQLVNEDGTSPGGLFTLVLRRTTDGWRIVHDHTSQATDPLESN